MTFLTVVSVAAGIMFGIGAIAAIYRIIRGPSIMILPVSGMRG